MKVTKIALTFSGCAGCRARKGFYFHIACLFCMYKQCISVCIYSLLSEILFECCCYYCFCTNVARCCVVALKVVFSKNFKILDEWL